MDSAVNSRLIADLTESLPPPDSASDGSRVGHANGPAPMTGDALVRLKGAIAEIKADVKSRSRNDKSNSTLDWCDYDIIHRRLPPPNYERTILAKINHALRPDEYADATDEVSSHHPSDASVSDLPPYDDRTPTQELKMDNFRSFIETIPDLDSDKFVSRDEKMLAIGLGRAVFESYLDGSDLTRWSVEQLNLMGVSVMRAIWRDASHPSADAPPNPSVNPQRQAHLMNPRRTAANALARTVHTIEKVPLVGRGLSYGTLVFTAPLASIAGIAFGSKENKPENKLMAWGMDIMREIKTRARAEGGPLMSQDFYDAAKVVSDRAGHGTRAREFRSLLDRMVEKGAASSPDTALRG